MAGGGAPGGKRAGAGRKRKGTFVFQPHRPRPKVEPGRRVKVTLWVRRRHPSLRQRAMRAALDYTTRTAEGRFGMRIVDVAPEERKLVLTVELDAPEELPRAMQGFGVRFAKAVQRQRR